MLVVALNGSPKPNGNTAQSLKIVLQELEKEGIQTELLQLGGKPIFGCKVCGKCAQSKDRSCPGHDDELNPILQRVFEADGILIGSPSYFSNMTPEVKAFIDRCGIVNGANGRLLTRKVGAAVVAARRAGTNFVFSSINLFFGITEMITVGSSYWNMTLAHKPGNVQQDEEGIRTFQTLGKNMAWLLKKINQEQS